MATITKTASGSWKAVIRKSGWPTTSKSFRTKRDTDDWARNVEDEMVRGVFINRADSHRLKLSVALDRYLSEVSPTKRASTASRELRRAKPLKALLGDYSLTAFTPEVIAKYRDTRVKGGQSASGVWGLSTTRSLWCARKKRSRCSPPATRIRIQCWAGL